MFARVVRSGAKFVGRKSAVPAVRLIQSKGRTAAAAIGFAGAVVATQAAGAKSEQKNDGPTPKVGIPGTSHERTFIAVKPDGVQRGLIAPIIERFERKGWKLVGMKLVKPSQDMAAAHYSDLADKPFYPKLVDFFSSGVIVAMVWEGKDVIKGGRTVLGATNPADSAPGTIRGDYCVEVGRNIIHGSDGPDSAQNEIDFWFRDDEVHDWALATRSWIYE